MKRMLVSKRIKNGKWFEAFIKIKRDKPRKYTY